jgi:hypothetical protein
MTKRANYNAQVRVILAYLCNVPVQYSTVPYGTVQGEHAADDGKTTETTTTATMRTGKTTATTQQPTIALTLEASNHRHIMLKTLGKQK